MASLHFEQYGTIPHANAVQRINKKVILEVKGNVSLPESTIPLRKKINI
jgi:hypothetical protein